MSQSSLWFPFNIFHSTLLLLVLTSVSFREGSDSYPGLSAELIEDSDSYSIGSLVTTDLFNPSATATATAGIIDPELLLAWTSLLSLNSGFQVWMASQVLVPRLRSPN